MQQIKDWATGSLKAVRAHVPLTVGLLVVVVLLIAGYNVFQALRLQANDVAAVSGAVAAVAGALAAFGALGAARESRKTAATATRALALATKPIPELKMIIDRSKTTLNRCSMTIEVENLSIHPLRSGTLSWQLRDGTSGTHPVGEIRGRRVPSYGMFHRAEGVETLLAADVFDGGIGGVDWVALEYTGDVRDIRWRNKFAIEWAVTPGSASEKDGVLIPNTHRVGYERSEVEL